MADLSVKYAGMELKNPLICGAGPPTDTIEGCKRAAEAGFGALVLKSLASAHIGPQSYQHAVPRFKVVDRLHPYERWNPDRGEGEMDIECIGEVGSVWSEDKYLWFINEVKREVGDELKVGASTYGSTREEVWDRHLDIFASSDADFVELATSDHNLRHLDIPKLIQKAKEKLKVPVIVKLQPFLAPTVERVKLLQDAGVDGVTMFDATMALDFDIETMSFPFRDTWCYFPSGLTVPYVNRCIAECRLAGLTTSISASFGPWEWQHVIKLILSGADTVQTCRKVMVRGHKIATEWLKEINDWLDAHKLESIAELKGRILENLVTDFRTIPREEPLERGGIPSLKTEIQLSKCGGCVNWCMPVCGYFALEPKDFKVAVDENKCAGCGACEGSCPFGAIALKPRT